MYTHGVKYSIIPIKPTKVGYEDWGERGGSLGGLIWIHLDSLGLTWIHLDSLGLTWIHLDSLGLTWTHLDSLGFTRTHWNSLREEGKAIGQKGKGKGRQMRFGMYFHLA